MGVYLPLYDFTYYSVIISVFLIVVSFLFWAKRFSVKINIGRFASLVKFESRRLVKGPLTDRMDATIAGSLLLSTLLALLNPFSVPTVLRYSLLAVSLPFVAGLGVAFWWKLGRARSSKNTGKYLGKDKEFQARSETLQSLLTLVIGLTMAQLILEWFSKFDYASNILNAARNILVAVYYVKPSTNLFKNFQRHISELRLPFNIEEIQKNPVPAGEIKAGVSKLSGFNRLELASMDSCVEIGACEAACPATAVGRPLSPRVLIRELAIQKSQGNMDANPMDAVNEDELWSCTTCAACVNSCPVGVKHLDIITDLRRNLVESNKLDKNKSALLGNLYQKRNSLGVSNSDRNKWITDMGVNLVSEAKGFEYLLWVGCMASFDPNAKKSIVSLVSLIKQAGMLDKVAIIGGEESCCGDPARRIGDEALFQDFAFNNIKIFKKYGVTNMLLVCPHGCNVFSNDYTKLDDWMKNVKVYHEAEFLDKLKKEGRLKLKETGKDLAIHDPCYLSRYNGVTQPQRSLLSGVAKVSEPHLHGKETFCCGAGGANYWYQVPEKKRISHERVDQLVETGAKDIVTMCPFCNSMLKDAVNTMSKDSNVYDIAEVLQASSEKTVPTR